METINIWAKMGYDVNNMVYVSYLMMYHSLKICFIKVLYPLVRYKWYRLPETIYPKRVYLYIFEYIMYFARIICNNIHM